MKIIFSVLLLLITLGTRAVNDSLLSCDKQTIENVKTLVIQDDAAEAMMLEGSATVTFEIDANNKVNIKSIQATDFTLAYHIRQTLQEAILCSTENLAGKTFTVLIQIHEQKQQLTLF